MEYLSISDKETVTTSVSPSLEFKRLLIRYGPNKNTIPYLNIIFQILLLILSQCENGSPHAVSKYKCTESVTCVMIL